MLQVPDQIVPTQNQIIHQISRSTRERLVKDRLDVLGDGPLGVPVRQLWEGLDRLVQDGPLRGVELDVAHAACPCFLLDVAPGLPRLYVEVFLDDSPADDSPAEEADPEEGSDPEEWRPLLVLANWLGEDTEPAIFELDPSQPDFSSVLAYVQEMAAARC